MPKLWERKLSCFAILQNMNTEPELTPGEACRTHSLTQQDFAQMCNANGSLKSRPQTTTFSLKDDPSRTITVDNAVLYISGTLLY